MMQKFKAGDTVRLSDVGLSKGLWPSCRVSDPSQIRGTVTKIARRTGTVYVRWHGWKVEETYTPDRTWGLALVTEESH